MLEFLPPDVEEEKHMIDAFGETIQPVWKIFFKVLEIQTYQVGMGQNHLYSQKWQENVT